ncbi:MAG: dihydrofolate reductase [Granulosicoccus sp.]|jgi:dihydrofolate reductase
MSEPVIAMMMAMDKNKLIGSDGGLPWHIPGELAYFKRVTMGKPIIMGRKTYDSIGKPLPGRANIVVTHNSEWTADGVTVVGSLDDAFEAGRQALKSQPAQEIVVIGGASLCQAAMSITQRLYLTVVDKAYAGDTWLDSFEWSDWQVLSEDAQSLEDTGGLPVTYFVLEK